MASSAVINSKRQMMIPAKLLAQLGVEPGTRIDLSVENGKLIGSVANKKPTERAVNFDEILALRGSLAGYPLEEELAESRREWEERLEKMCDGM